MALSRIGLHLLPTLLLLAAVPSVHAQSAVQAVHNLPADALPDWLERMAKEKYRPVYVNGYSAGGRVCFAVVAVPDDKGAIVDLRHDLTAEQLTTQLADPARKGQRLQCLSGYLSDDGPRFAALWIKEDKPARWEARHQLTSREYQETVATLAKKGLRPDIVTGYADGTGTHRFAALFVEDKGSPWEDRFDLTEEQLQKENEAWSAKGYRPSSISTYPTADGLRFSVQFIKDSAKSSFKHLTAEQYQAEDARQLKDGFRPLCVAAYQETDPEVLPPVVQKFMKDRGIPAGTLAVSRGGKLLLKRGFGFADTAGKRQLRPEDPLRLATVTRPITAAAIRTLVADGKLALDTKVFPLLGLKPMGAKADMRLNDVTVQHLLDHQGGWEESKTFDPTLRPLEIATALGKPGPAGADDMVKYMMGYPLQFDPGSKTVYSNFDYLVLGRVVEKASGKRYVEYVCDRLLAPLEIKSVELARSLPKDRNPREPFYFYPSKKDGGVLARNVVQPQSKTPVPPPDGGFYMEAMDSTSGLIGSAVDLTRFMDAYALTGERRAAIKGGARHQTGNQSGTYTLALQRGNGVSIAALFNRFTDPPGPNYNKLIEMVAPLADKMTGAVQYAVVWVKSEP